MEVQLIHNIILVSEVKHGDSTYVANAITVSVVIICHLTKQSYCNIIDYTPYAVFSIPMTYLYFVFSAFLLTLGL